MYRIKVKAGYRWSQARVAGRAFSKFEVVELHEVDMSEEIHNSPLLEVEEVRIVALVEATAPAQALANDLGVDVQEVTGTGEDGRVLVRDVRDYVAAVEAQDEAYLAEVAAAEVESAEE